MKDLTTNNFTEAIANGISVVDFWATWCAPCKMLTPILEELSTDIVSANFYKIDADENVDIVQQYDVRSIPTVIIFNNGEPIASQIGAHPKVKMRKFIEDSVSNVI